jgi:tRNA nucleotidyltransferase/poly(A) polymerase
MPDYMYQLESRLSPEQRAGLVRIQELAAANESNLYLVGGAVRDLISGMPIRDLDFTIEGNPTKIVKELEKGGAQLTSESEPLRSAELVLSGDVDASISAAREEVYARPGTKFEARFSTIMEDLKRRDFSINAIAISLNVNSRGLLLDPTNGLADLERREIRALSIHSFTNQPVRLLRALRYVARMDFKMDSRTSEWFKLAIERKLQETVSPEDAGHELWQVAREENPAAVLKAWEAQDLLTVLNPQLAKRHPDYEAIQRVVRVREDMVSAGFRPRLFAPVTAAILGKLKDRELASALEAMGLSSSELRAVEQLESEASKVAKILSGPKTASIPDTYAYLEKTPLDLQAYILAESSNAKAVGKIKNYLNKWKPLRQGISAVAVELEAIGLEHGPKFDKVLEDFFQAQLMGRARKPEDHAKILRKLAGIKEPPKKIEEKKKPEKPKKKGANGVSPEVTVAPEASKPKGSAAPAPTSGNKFQSSAKVQKGKPAVVNEPAKFGSKAGKKSKSREGKK